jgi:hypothetical protein
LGRGGGGGGALVVEVGAGEVGVGQEDVLLF